MSKCIISTVRRTMLMIMTPMIVILARKRLKRPRLSQSPMMKKRPLRNKSLNLQTRPRSQMIRKRLRKIRIWKRLKKRKKRRRKMRMLIEVQIRKSKKKTRKKREPKRVKKPTHW
jgi:hypothetical protein